MLTILTYPHPTLLKPAQPISLDELKRSNESLRELVDAMFTTMRAAPGVGLAAPQVGVSRQLFIMDCGARGTGAYTFINPVIHRSEGQQECDEGCLSFPGIFEKVKRYELVELHSYDVDGNQQRHVFTGFESVCVQHELEHLHGHVFIEHLSSLKQAFIRKKMFKRAGK